MTATLHLRQHRNINQIIGWKSILMRRGNKSLWAGYLETWIEMSVQGNCLCDAARTSFYHVDEQRQSSEWNVVRAVSATSRRMRNTRGTLPNHEGATRSEQRRKHCKSNDDISLNSEAELFYICQENSYHDSASIQ